MFLNGILSVCAGSPNCHGRNFRIAMVIAGNLSTLNVLEFFLEFWISVISVRNSDFIRLLHLLLAGLHSSAAGTTDNTLCRPRWVPTTSDPGSTSIAVGGTHDEQALPHMLLAAPLAAAP